jgi:tetrahedral aminopeptidase
MINHNSMNFLKKLMGASSPAGFEFEVRKIWKEEMKDKCEKLDADYHGNIWAIANESLSPKIVLAGHIDEVGFIVRYIDDNGFIYIRPIGGIDLAIVQARKVKIRTKNGDIPGVIGRKALHLLSGDEGKSAPSIDQIFIDIGAKSGDEAKKLVEIGDPITYTNTIEELRNNIYCSKAFDNRLGAFIVAEVMKNIYSRKDELKASLYSVGTCQEEGGIRGIRSFSHKIKADVGIAVDGTFSVDTPHSNQKKEGNVAIGKGPALARGANTNPKLYELMTEICKEKEIPYQIEAEPGGNGTDADGMQVIMGCATALVSIPLRYMHTQYEVICTDDVENVIKLLTELCLRIDEKTDLIP